MREVPGSIPGAAHETLAWVKLMTGLGEELEQRGRGRGRGEGDGEGREMDREGRGDKKEGRGDKFQT